VLFELNSRHAAGKSCFAPLLALLLLAVSTWACAADVAVIEGKVVGIVDGDTIDLLISSGMIRIRLHAIDAPERGQSRGRASRDALSRMIFGRSVQVEPVEHDRYDRLVARIWLGETDINAAMIRQGHAWTYRRYADDPDYCAYEQMAREQQLGLWALPPEQRRAPWEWRQRRSLKGRFTDYTEETVELCVAALP